MIGKKERRATPPHPSEPESAPAGATEAPGSAAAPAGGTEAPASDSPDGRAALEADLARARAREEELLRALAELTNATRRRKQEMESSVLYAEESIVRSLLPVLDDFERALTAWDRSPDDPMRAGLALIHDRLRQTLEQQGLEEIRPAGEAFDPALHDALLQKPSADVPPDRVVEVIKPGYRFRGRVLRHAQVVVSGPPGAEALEAERR